MCEYHLRKSTVFVTAAAFFTSIGCTVDDGPSLTAEIDKVGVQEALSQIATSIPECDSNAGEAKSAPPSVRQIVKELVRGPLAPVMSREIGIGTYSGTCTVAPGILDISQVSHESGVTTLAIAFESFCTLSQAGAATYITGNATIVDHGNPSDDGPIVDKRTGNTDGDGLQITGFDSEGEERSAVKIMDKTVVLKDFTRNYGTPYNYFVGENPPTEEAPDSAIIGEFVISDNLNDLTITATDISCSFYETAPGEETTDLVVTVSQLVASVGDSGTVSFKSDEGSPLVINSSNALTSGSVTMTGKTGEATITVNGANTFAIDVNGEPLAAGTAMDCSSFNYEDFVRLP